MPSRTYRCPLTVDFDPSASSTTPVRFDVDFAQLIGPDTKGLVDPHTIRVRRKLAGQTRSYNVQFDETLYQSNKGWVAFLADQPELGGEWTLEFRLRGPDGQLAKFPCMPVVGVGDELHAQAKRWNPICVPGMHSFPIPVDFDGDGLVDILSVSHYSNTQGMPWSGVFFWKNIGSNQRPRYAPPMRLMADGVEMTDFSRTHGEGEWQFEPRRDFISEYYIRCDVFDWFGNGRHDLITASRHGEIRIYENTGKKDAAGIPELRLATKIPLPKCLAPASYLGFRVVDWDGSGRGSFLIGIAYKEVGLEYGQLLLMRNVSRSPRKPKFKLIKLPDANFWRPGDSVQEIDMADEGWRKVQNFTGMRTFSMDYFDIDNDGKEELLLVHGNQRPQTMMEVWRNVGTADKPLLRFDKKIPWFSHSHHFSMRFTRNAAFDGCVIAGMNAGWGMRYYKRVKADGTQPDSHRDAGLLLGEGAKINAHGYVRPWPMPDKQGRVELLCGDEPGYLSRIENVGSAEKPIFAWPEKITDKKGNPLHLSRENLFHDNNLEWCCGQLKPCVCDWDGDGKLDIIVSGNTNRIYWLKDYNPEKRTVGTMQELGVKGDPNPFAWRKGVAVLDFDGDGKLELIAVNASQEFCIYKQGRGKNGLTELRLAQKLHFKSGRAITTNDIPPAIYAYGVAIIFACDFTGNGKMDLLVSSNYNTSLLENVGTNRNPLFKKPKLLTTPDGPISICHHESQVASCDINGDGIDEVIIGGESGTIYVFHRDWLSHVKHTAQVAALSPG